MLLMNKSGGALCYGCVGVLGIFAGQSTKHTIFSERVPNLAKKTCS